MATIYDPDVRASIELLAEVNDTINEINELDTDDYFVAKVPADAVFEHLPTKPFQFSDKFKARVRNHPNRFQA